MSGLAAGWQYEMVAHSIYRQKKAGTDEEGVYIWKLREELEAALKETDLSQISLYVVSQEEDEPHYWWLNANPNIWRFFGSCCGRGAVLHPLQRERQ